MSLHDHILDYIDDEYGDYYSNEEIDKKIAELQELITELGREINMIDDEDIENEDNLIDYRPNMDDFNDEE